MINIYLEFVNGSNNVYKIKADVGIKIRSADAHIQYSILQNQNNADNIILVSHR